MARRVGLNLTVVLISSAIPLLAASPDMKEVEGLIQQLGSSNFTEREAASKRLDAIGEPALESLQKAALQSKDPEVRRRAEALLSCLLVAGRWAR